LPLRPQQLRSKKNPPKIQIKFKSNSIQIAHYQENVSPTFVPRDAMGRPQLNAGNE
jgi:hypothetical protein